MASPAWDLGDPALLTFIAQLVADNSLDGEAMAVARKLLEERASALAELEHLILEQEVIEPYFGECEACNSTPSWAEMLHVYDTGLCAGCFDKLEDSAKPDVRPDWMPLVPPVVEDDEEETAVTATTIPAPLGA